MAKRKVITIAKAWGEMTPEEKCMSLKCNWKYCGENCIRDAIDKYSGRR